MLKLPKMLLQFILISVLVALIASSRVSAQSFTNPGDNFLFAIPPTNQTDGSYCTNGLLSTPCSANLLNPGVNGKVGRNNQVVVIVRIVNMPQVSLNAQLAMLAKQNSSAQSLQLNFTELNGILAGASISPSPTPSISPSPSSSPSSSVTPSPTISVSPSISITPSITPSTVATASPTISATATPTTSPTALPSSSPSLSPAPSPTPILIPVGNGTVTYLGANYTGIVSNVTDDLGNTMYQAIDITANGFFFNGSFYQTDNFVLNDTAISTMQFFPKVDVYSCLVNPNVYNIFNQVNQIAGNTFEPAQVEVYMFINGSTIPIMAPRRPWTVLPNYGVAGTYMVASYRTLVISVDQGTITSMQWESSFCRVTCGNNCIYYPTAGDYRTSPDKDVCGVPCNPGDCSLQIFIAWVGTDRFGNRLTSETSSINKFQNWYF